MIDLRISMRVHVQVISTPDGKNWQIEDRQSLLRIRRPVTAHKTPAIQRHIVRNVACLCIGSENPFVF